ncbi:MAG: glycosyltransferase [Candidatus Eisenbacteria bacterium]
MPTSVSVIVVNYNGGLDAVENLRALSGQLEGTGWELVVVDNRSTDGSPDLMTREAPAARLFCEPENRGYASAVNRGLEEASGDVLVVLNADVVPRPGALAILADAVDANRHYAFLGGVLMDGRGKPSPNTARMLPRPAEILREALFVPARRPSFRDDAARAGSSRESGIVPVPVIGGAVMAVHRETLAVLGPMDTEYFLYDEDIEWCRRAARKGMSVGVVTGAMFDHQGGASTRLNEGPAFAARVLADFQYFCEGEGVAPERIRRLWRVRLVLRSWLYRADARLGILGRRPESRKRAAIYRILAGELAAFSWSTSSGLQNGHPSRLFRFPAARREDPEDPRRRVLQLIPNMEYGGAQRLVETLVAGSLSERYRFEVLCQTHAGEIGEELARRGVPVHVAGMSGWLRLSGWKRFADYAALFEPDLVHSHLIPGDVAAHVGFGGRVHRLSTKHNTDPKFGRTVRLIEWFVLRGTPVLAVSDAVALSKPHLGPWGVLPPVLQSPPAVPIAQEPAPIFRKDRPVRLGAIGRLHPQKRLDIYIKAAAELERRFPGRFSFRVVGEGKELHALEELATSLGIRDRIDFHPPVSDVARMLDDTDIVIMVSDYEGLPLAILEMLARGRIPLIRRVPGTDEALPTALERCYVDSSSHVDVAEKVIEICDEPDLFVELAREGLRCVARRSDYASVTGRIYEGLLSTDAPFRRTRVLHLITRLIVGGAQENTIASVERVDPTRYDSQLWTGPQTGPEGSLMSDARSRGIVVRVLPNMVREISPLKDILMLMQLTRLLRRERFDIVHTHCSKAGILGRVAARFAGVPHITHTHHGWSFHDRMHPVLKRLFVAAERSLGPWTHPMISVSDKTTEVGLEAGIGSRSDYRLIRSGIPLRRYHPDGGRGRVVRREMGIPADHVVVCSVGRLTPQKNPMDFVKLAATLLDGHENLTFLYVGDGPMRASVEEAAEAACVGDRLRLLGVRDDVPDLLRASDVFVLTSLWEGLPRVVLQALASGVPVLAYDTAGIAEVVVEGKNGHLVPRGSVEEMASRLTDLVEDAGRRAAMSRSAAEEFDRAFSESQMILDLENLYDEMVRSRKARRASGR